MSQVHTIQHPLIQHKLTLLRDRNTDSAQFRSLLSEVSMMLTYEATRSLTTSLKTIDTPLTSMQSPMIDGKKIAVISILRAGNGMLDGVLKIIPSIKIGCIGLARDHESLQPKEYFVSLPKNLPQREVIVLDPMLATGGSAVYAISRIKKESPKSIKFISLLAAPEGIESFCKAHPDVAIYCAAIDERLDHRGYILPGLGDAGDRIFGT